MDTTPLPPEPSPDRSDGPQAARPTRPTRRTVSRTTIALVAGLSILLAIGIVLAFRPKDSGTDVIKLDPDATEPFNGLTGGTDVVGRSVHGVTYLTFDGQQAPLHPGDTPVLINFWSSTCAPCIKEMPALEAAQQAHAGEITVIGIDHLEVPELGQDMIRRTGVTYDVGRDPKGTLLRSLGGNALPFSVLVGADGVILAVHAGQLDAAGIDAFIAPALVN
jgi:thiol-disulfide isomerase/thioredoxin